jgi:hypothetical protein
VTTGSLVAPSRPSPNGLMVSRRSSRKRIFVMFNLPLVFHGEASFLLRQYGFSGDTPDSNLYAPPTCTSLTCELIIRDPSLNNDYFRILSFKV